LARRCAKGKRYGIFCGSDYDENSFWKQCYPESELYIIKRNGISSTEIRKNPYAHWDSIPNVVREYYVKKVLLIGGESTGKSTLTINLANYYNTNYVEEVGREISMRSGTDMLMIPSDFTDILLTHKNKATKYYSLIPIFYIDFLDDPQNDKERFYLEPDVEFVQDGDRSEVIAANREKYGNQIKKLFDERGIKYISVSGNYHERFLRVTSEVDRMLGINRAE